MGAADLVAFSALSASSVGSWGRPRKLKRAFNVEEKDLNSGVPEISSLLWPTTRWSFSLEESTAKRRTTRIHRYPLSGFRHLAATQQKVNYYLIRASSRDGNNRLMAGIGRIYICANYPFKKDIC